MNKTKEEEILILKKENKILKEENIKLKNLIKNIKDALISPQKS